MSGVDDEIVPLVVGALCSIALPWGVVRRDRARLAPAWRARAWNAPSFACAVVFFGPLCLVAHFWITRRSARGALVGLAASALALAAVAGVQLAVGAALDAW